MTYIQWIAVFTTVALWALATHRAAGADFFVSTQGSDTWSGRLAEPNDSHTDGPFATVKRAQFAVRGLKRLLEGERTERPITVLVRGGTYYLDSPLLFDSVDSGSKQNPIVYAAYPGEQPVLSGGRLITSEWQTADGKIYTTHIPEVADGQWYFRQLFVNGERARQARMPNEGYLHLAGLVVPDNRADPINRTSFRFAPGDIKADWTNLEDVEVIKLFDWSATRLRIAQVDEESHTVTFTGGTGPDPRLFDWAGDRYYIENVYEGLDSPGEWYLNRRSGVLYYWPLPGEDMTEAEVIAPVVEQLVRLEGDIEAGEFVEHLTLRGLTLCHSDWTLPKEGYMEGQAAIFVTTGAIYAEGALSCRLEDNHLAHIGTYAIVLGRGCQDNRIVGNRIHDVGAGGIKVGESIIPGAILPLDPEKDIDEACRNVICDNYIYDGGHVYVEAVGIWIGQSSGNVVSHNEIHDLNYTGISVGWIWGYAPTRCRDNIIEYNHIYNIGRAVLNDLGGIYTLGVQPGTKLRYNLIHDIDSSRDYGWGLYADNGSSNILFENNVVYNTKTGGFHQGSGRENIVRNNIFAFSRHAAIMRWREEEHISFTFERNIVYINDGQLLGFSWGNGNYRMDYNLYWDTSEQEIKFAGSSFDEWQSQGRDPNSIIADPLFVDSDNGDFALKPESPAFNLGFKPIDISTVGPRR